MYHKLSNNTNKDAIEKEFNTLFKYPALYESTPIFNGLQEQTIPIITAENSNQVSLAIWGMLPINYMGHWEEYQKNHTTLTVSITNLEKTFNDVFSNLKKCVFVVSGFFTIFIKNGIVYPYYVYKNIDKPMLLAGVYNVLEDGFLTCSLLLTQSNKFIRKINNSNDMMPLVIEHDSINHWLDGDSIIFKDILENSNSLFAHTINRQFYENDILFPTVLEPEFYEGIPNYFSSGNSRKIDF